MCENTNKAYTKAVEYLKTSPMFNLSLSSNELFHSNFLYWIWKTNEDCFKKIINSLIGEENYWDNNWGGKQLAVRREYKNFDLSIVEVLNSSKTEEDSDNKVNQTTSEPENGKYSTDGLILFVLENKVKSIPYAQQLLKYNEKIKNHNEEILKKEILKERQLKKWTKNNDLKEELDKRINDSTCKKVLLSLTDAYPDIQLDNGYFKEWKKYHMMNIYQT